MPDGNTRWTEKRDKYVRARAMSRRKYDWDARFFRHHRRHKEFHRYHQMVRVSRPLVLIFYLLIIYLLFSWAGYKAIGIILAILIGVKEITQVYFLWRLDKRILEPIVKLDAGVQEIAKGNYHISIENNVENEIGLLIDSFNEMARKLAASEKLHQDYEENRRNLVASISHDLKTPIAAIQGYIEAILAGAADSGDKLEKYLQVIDNNTAYVNRLIDDLLLFSQLDIKKLDFKFEKLEFKAYMDDLVEELRFELNERDVRLDYLVDLECSYSVCIDSKRFYQALRNVVGNAVKYGPEQGLLIKVELSRRGQFLCLAVTDNGPGIPPDKLDHIFERFYRIDSERTKDLMSTGLGLAIARELIEAHGGRIELVSQVGQGSSFILNLPINREDQSTL